MAGIIVNDCPHCMTQKIAMPILGALSFPEKTLAKTGKVVSGRQFRHWCVAFAAACPNCHKPLAILALGPEADSYSSHNTKLGHMTNFDHSGFERVSIWPEPPKPVIPPDTPEKAVRALLQAERNYHIPDNEDAAGAMYRKALDVGLAERFPAVTGTLVKRIDKLVDAHELTKQIGEWAHEIRHIGNDAVHDDPIDRTELTAMRGFVDAVFRYVFTLPAEIERRKKSSA